MDASDINNINREISKKSKVSLDGKNGFIFFQDENNTVGQRSGVVVLEDGIKFHFFMLNNNVNFLSPDLKVKNKLETALSNQIKELHKISKEREQYFNNAFGIDKESI